MTRRKRVNDLLCPHIIGIYGPRDGLPIIALLELVADLQDERDHIIDNIHRVEVER